MLRGTIEQINKNICVFFGSQVKSYKGEIISFGPQNYTLLFDITWYHIKRELAGKLATHMRQNGGWDYFTSN